MGQHDSLNGFSAMVPGSGVGGFDTVNDPVGDGDQNGAPHRFGRWSDITAAGWESAWIDLGGEG
jgi:hypothetical protein